LFPTILALLGLPLSSDLDGRVLTEALSKEYLQAHPLQWEDRESTPSEDTPTDRTYSAEDEDEIADRLKGLGYLD
jgi:hypothetical protein